MTLSLDAPTIFKLTTTDELDQKMRVYETAADYCVLPGVFMVARLDGRSFSRLTRELCQFEAPFDQRFRDMMVNTAEGLMNCGLRVKYAYTQSDEISLLFDKRGYEGHSSLW
jgi:tRNA(His) guanylyltransferase